MGLESTRAKVDEAKANLSSGKSLPESMNLEKSSNRIMFLSKPHRDVARPLSRTVPRSR